MKTIGIIPARGGSKGILNKNVKSLVGKPLIYYTIRAALDSNLDRVVVSTEDKQIKKTSLNYGVEVIDRPIELAQDSTPTLPVIQYTLQHLENSYDAVMILQPTSPLRNHRHINEAVSLFENDMKADSLVSVVKVPHNFSPDKVMTFDGNYLQGNLDITRRQQMKLYFARNGAAIYLTRFSKIHEYIFGGNILPYFMNKNESIDIDDDDDFALTELLMRGKNT